MTDARSIFIPVSAVTSAMKDQQLALDSDRGHLLTFWRGLASTVGPRANRGSSPAIILFLVECEV